MKTTLFTHEADLDGIFSAAIGLIRYPEARTLFLNYSRENFIKMINQISLSNDSNEKNIFIISDLGFNNNLLNIFKNTFINAKKHNNKIIWVDHHPWSETTINEMRDTMDLVLDVSGKKCAAELMQERFLIENEHARKLANIAHSMDFFTKDQYLTPISEIIKYYLSFNDANERLSRLAKKVANNILWDLDMNEDYKKYSILREKDKKVVLSKIKVKKIRDLNVVFVKSSPYLQTSLFSEEVFKLTDADLAIFYGKNGKISIRRNNEKIACNEIACKLIDGGGHKFAAGGKIRSYAYRIGAIISEIEDIVIKVLNDKSCKPV